MIIILGLIILVAAVVVAVAGVLDNDGSTHALGHFSVLGYHVTGSAGTLFLSGIVVGAAGLLGLGDTLIEQRDTARATDASTLSNGTTRQSAPPSEAASVSPDLDVDASASAPAE